MFISLHHSIKLLVPRQSAQQLFYLRCCSTSATDQPSVRSDTQATGPVRVRFAPSPTGKLNHISIFFQLIHFIRFWSIQKSCDFNLFQAIYIWVDCVQHSSIIYLPSHKKEHLSFALKIQIVQGLYRMRSRISFVI